MTSIEERLEKIEDTLGEVILNLLDNAETYSSDLEGVWMLFRESVIKSRNLGAEANHD